MGERRDLPVEIRPDANANVQALATAMSTAGELGFVDINFATVTSTATR
jgi:biopolymer transport protein ExbD